MRCDACAHWSLDDRQDWEAEKAGFGYCVGILPRWTVTKRATDALALEWPGGPDVRWDSDEACLAWENAEREAILAQKAYVQDGSEYRAELYTAPDFFCARWAAQGIEAGTGETREAGLDTKCESPVAESDAPNPCSGSPDETEDAR